MRGRALLQAGTLALSGFLLACVAAAAPPAITLYRPDCGAISPRVPAVFAGLPWIVATPPGTHVFVGEAIASASVDAADTQDAQPAVDADDSSPWANSGGIYLRLREVDLNGDQLCDLVATVKSAISTGGDSETSLVFWFASPMGWRRQGPDWDERASTLHPMSRALLGPDSAADFALYGYATYAPMRLADGRVVLAARASLGRTPADAAPVTVLAYDAKQAIMSPLAATKTLASTLGALGDRVCVKGRSADEACLTWLN